MLGVYEDIEMNKENILELSHVCSGYEDGNGRLFGTTRTKEVLRDVSFTVYKNEFLGLVGESGCGKSTLGNVILNLQPFEGSVRIAGTDLSVLGRKERSSRIQAVFQDPMSALNPRKTIGFTMREPLRAHHIGTVSEQEEAVRQMLRRVGLDEAYADRYPRELSGGQRQRACIGAALMLQPDLVVADEAISALDVSVGAQILNLFREIDEQRSFSMLFISHNMNVVYYLCDRIAVMYRGRIVELGTAEAVYRTPAHPYTRLLLSSVPDWNRHIEDDGTKTLREVEAQFMQLEESHEDPKGGCCFYHRCPRASEACRIAPEARNLAGAGEEAHWVSCCAPQTVCRQEGTHDTCN